MRKRNEWGKGKDACSRAALPRALTYTCARARGGSTKGAALRSPYISTCVSIAWRGREREKRLGFRRASNFPLVRREFRARLCVELIYVSHCGRTGRERERERWLSLLGLIRRIIQLAGLRDRDDGSALGY